MYKICFANFGVGAGPVSAHVKNIFVILLNNLNLIKERKSEEHGK